MEPTDAPDANFPSDTPVERYPSMAEDHRLLTVMTGQHTDVVHQLMSGGGGTAFAFDIFLFGLVERSLHLVYGFLATFDAWNLVAAAPLVRLQIDNLVRLCYVRRHPRMHEVALAALETEFRNMKDDQKKPLRDYRLVELAGRHHPWVPTVYESANSWVHLSPRQLTGPLTPTEVPGRLNVKVRHVIDDYPEAFLSEVLDSMRACTEEILAYVENWVHTKNDPSAGEQV